MYGIKCKWAKRLQDGFLACWYLFISNTNILEQFYNNDIINEMESWFCSKSPNFYKDCIKDLIPATDLVVTSLPYDQEVPSSIASSVMGFFSDGELFHGVYGLDASAFQCPLSIFCPLLPSEVAHRSGEALQLCPCSYMWSTETLKTTDIVIFCMKLKLKKKY